MLVSRSCNGPPASRVASGGARPFFAGSCGASAMRVSSRDCSCECARSMQRGMGSNSTCSVEGAADGAWKRKQGSCLVRRQRVAAAATGLHLSLSDSVSSQSFDQHLS